MRGIRYNLVVADSVTSITKYGTKTVWDGRIMKAECPYLPYKPDHRNIPERGCQCGFYAFSGIAHMDGLTDLVATLAVVTLVEAYGDVLVHRDGFRAGYMKPLFVVWPLEVLELKSVKSDTGILVHWEPTRYLMPEFELALKATKILNVPLLSPNEVNDYIQ